MEIIILYEFYQFAGICRIRCISGLLQPICPRLIVCNLVVEKESISLTVTQEIRMVTERILGIIILPETLSFGIIIMINPATLPSIVAFDSEMVIAFESQF